MNECPHEFHRACLIVENVLKHPLDVYRAHCARATSYVHQANCARVASKCSSSTQVLENVLEHFLDIQQNDIILQMKITCS